MIAGPTLRQGKQAHRPGPQKFKSLIFYFEAQHTQYWLSRFNVRVWVLFPLVTVFSINFIL
jgi:hypothetical protein